MASNICPDDHARIQAAIACLLQGQSLPLEVVDHIARYFETKDLLNINSISSALNTVANTAIYHNVVVDVQPSASQKPKSPLVLFLRTLLTSEGARSQVHTFHLCGFPLHEWRKENWDYYARERSLRNKELPIANLPLQSFTCEELNSYAKLTSSQQRSGEYPAPLADVSFLAISLLSQLRHLRIESDFFRYASFTTQLRQHGETAGFKYLESAEFCSGIGTSTDSHCSMYMVCGRDEALLTPLLAPTLKCFTTAVALDSVISNGFRSCPITKLVLRRCRVSESRIGILLSATPYLRHFEYQDFLDFSHLTTRTRHDQQKQELELDYLFDALYHVRGTLEHLVVSEHLVEDYPVYHPDIAGILMGTFRPHSGLSSLQCLRTLEIPFVLLLGWKPRQEDARDWANLLPASVRHITWTDDLTETFRAYDWDDLALIKEMRDLVGWLMDLVQTDQSHAQFDLRLLRWEYEWPASMRDTLRQLCADHGVSCSVTKSRPDVSDERLFKFRADQALKRSARGRLGRGRGRG